MKCFLYCRKSSEDQSRQVQSIADQKKILNEIATQRGLIVSEIFTDEKSAGKPYQRKGFQEMMERINSGETNIILTWKIDRLSRNPIENGQISWMLQQGGIQQIVTPDRTYLPQDNVLLFMVEGAMANQYLRDLSKNVKRGMHSKVERGIYPAFAPFGYLNEGKYKGHKTIVPDPKYFPKLKALWDLLKTEKYQLADLYRIMQDKYPLDKYGKPVSFSSFHRIFHNPFYCGIFRWGGEEHLGTHQTMLSQSEFKKIQSHLNKKDKTRQKELVFDYKGAIKCGTCDSLITAERKQKLIKSTGYYNTYDYYKCAHHRRHIECKEKPLSKNQIEVFLNDEVDKLHLPKDVIDFGLEELKSKQTLKSSNFSDTINALSREITSLKKQKSIVENNLALESDPDIRKMIMKKYNEMKIQIQRLEEDKVSLRKEIDNRNNDISNKLTVISKAKKIIEMGTPLQKMELLDTLGSNWRIQGRELQYSPNFICQAIVRVKELHSNKIAMFEPTKKGSANDLTVPFEDVEMLWRSVWEFMENFPSS
ncbi:MAG: recombinase family protein [Bacteroidales bacterium]|jgi:DNA invertase Pin-like site-specific DNA recombinase|nr:recombinase family protein [Bacteroidales bacterium]